MKIESKKVFWISVVLCHVLQAAAMAESESASQAVKLIVPDMARLGVSGEALTLILEDPGEGFAGTDPGEAEDSSSSLEYTSVVPAGNLRKVTVQLGADLSSGYQLELKVVQSDLSQSEGIANAIPSLSAIAQDLITNIGSCATGGSGPVLHYKFSFSAVTDLAADAAGTDHTVTFTLTEAGPPG